MTGETRAKYAAANIEFVHGKAEEFTLDIERFDESWMNNCLQHVEHPNKVMAALLSDTDAVGIFEWIEVPTDAMPADFPPLYLDRNAFNSVIFNLVHNAAKYADKNSEVDIRCSFVEPDSAPALAISSTGEPISLVERDDIFNKFARGSVAISGRHHTGVGLGLWVARTLMRQLGGDITLSLVATNPRVAKFVVHFPKVSTS